jgi:hypothetical protein
MKDKQLEPDKEGSTGIVKHCLKVTETQWNATLRNRRVFPNPTPRAPYVRSYSDKHWRNKC